MILKYLCYPTYVHLDDPNDRSFPCVLTSSEDDAYNAVPAAEAIYGCKFTVRAVYFPSKVIPDVMREPVNPSKPSV